MNKNKLNMDIKLMKDFFMKEFPRKKKVIENELFTIEILLWADKSFTITLFHRFERKNKFMSYELEKTGSNIIKEILECKVKDKEDFENKSKVIKEENFVLEKGKVVPTIEMELIKKTINNKEKFIKYFRRISGIEEGDIFNAIKKKYGNKEVYFYPEQYEKDKKLLTKNVKELLKNKGYKRKQINNIFMKIETGELKENYIWSCPKLNIHKVIREL